VREFEGCCGWEIFGAGESLLMARRSEYCRSWNGGNCCERVKKAKNDYMLAW
jgi:hypothetical protein